MFAPRPSTQVKSPCVDVCVMDEESGYCLGCKRTINEIASWGTASDTERLAVLGQLDDREVPAIELD